MWTYKSKTGELLKPNGTRLGYGFAGKKNGDKDGLNNPDLQYTKNTGPLPQGTYKMSAWHESHPRLGLCCIQLTPLPETDMKGRSDFFIHGSRNLFNSGLEIFLHSSDGCIIIGDCNTRREIWKSLDDTLFVDPS